METGDYHSFIVRWYNKHETAIGHLPVTMTTIVALFHIHHINNNISSKKKKKKGKIQLNKWTLLCDYQPDCDNNRRRFASFKPKESRISAMQMLHDPRASIFNRSTIDQLIGAPSSIAFPPLTYLSNH